MSRIADLEEQLATTRADQARDQERLTSLANGEAQAARDPAAFEKWSNERKTLGAQIERREALIPVLEGDLANALERRAALHERHAAKSASNPLLAKRFQTQWPELARPILDLVQELTASSIEDNRISLELRELGSDRTPLVSAELLTRASMPQPEKLVKKSDVRLWCRADTFDIIGDQNEVRDLGNGRGFCVSPMQHSIECVRRNFCEEHLLPEIWSPWPDPVWTGLRLPSCDRAEPLFDGSSHSLAEAASVALTTPQPPKPKVPRRVPIVRLKPLPDDPQDPADAERADRPQQLADASDALNGS